MTLEHWKASANIYMEWWLRSKRRCSALQDEIDELKEENKKLRKERELFKAYSFGERYSGPIAWEILS